MREDRIHGLFLALLEKADVLLCEHRHELSEEVHCVWLVLRVGISVADDLDNAADHIRLSQHLEEAIVLAEITESLRSIKSHMQVIVHM